ncbi:MAG: DUF1987 domain-containing protein [Halanaerobiales bacterium]
MREFHIEATKSSPEITYIAEENVLKFEGESYPEDSFSFYNPVIEFLQEVLEENDLKLIFKISYLNTSSTKSFMNLLDIVEEAYHGGRKVSVKWFYEKDNEHSYELALDFKEYLKLPFTIKAEAN